MDIQDLVDGFGARMQRERAKTQMTLGNMITALEAMPADTEVYGLYSPHSYRGYYSDLAFEPKPEKVSARDLLAECKTAMGKVFEGYKGGDFVMGALTPVWIANYGDIGLKIIAINSDGTVETAEAFSDPMPNIFAFDYDSKPTQPREAKPMNRISDSEIRLKVLESKEFAYAAGEKLRDELTNEQAALLGYFLFAKHRLDEREFNIEPFNSYVLDVLYPILKQVFDSEVMNYIDKHNLNDEQDDCSAFKEHRELNPDHYKDKHELNYDPEEAQ